MIQKACAAGSWNNRTRSWRTALFVALIAAAAAFTERVSAGELMVCYDDGEEEVCLIDPDPGWD